MTLNLTVDSTPLRSVLDDVSKVIHDSPPCGDIRARFQRLLHKRDVAVIIQDRPNPEGEVRLTIHPSLSLIRLGRQRGGIDDL